MQKPDFSGTWTLDPASAPAAGGGGRGGGPLGLNSKLKKPDNAVTGGDAAIVATTLNALWPTISTRRAAKAAALISAATTLSGALLYFVLEGEAIAQYGTLALVYPALLCIIAWRTWRLSRAWSLVGVSLAGLMVTVGLFTGPDVGGILGLFTMLTGYRGAVAARRLESD